MFIYIYTVKGEIDQLSTNTFKYRANYFNGDPLVPLINTDN